MASTTYVETSGEAVAPNGCQIALSSQQHGVQFMLVPAEQVQTAMLAGAMPVPLVQCHGQNLNAAAQPQVWDPRDAFARLQKSNKTHVKGPMQFNRLVDHAADNTVQGRLTSSAARRLRRQKNNKTRAETLKNQSTTSETYPGLHKDLPTASACKGPSALGWDTEMLGALELKLSAGGKERKEGVEAALAAIRGNVWTLSCDPTGTRLVQLALRYASQQETSKLVVELHGHVQEAATSPHANHVIQKVVELLTFSTASFVAKELAGSSARLAKHRFGCRIFCRLLEEFSTESLTSQLVDELLADKEELCCHSFARHVMQMVLEHDERHRDQVVAALLSNPVVYANLKGASYLIEGALLHGCQEDKQVLLARLSHPNAIACMARSQFGSYVVRALHKFEDVELKQAVLDTVNQIMPELRVMEHGQKLLVDLGLEQCVSEHGSSGS